jgi:hypothetical protein
VDLFGAFLFPLAFVIQLPLHIFLIVLERESGLRTLMSAMGLRMRSYYGVTCAMNFMLYCAVVSVFWIAGASMELRLFTQTAPSMLICFLVGWGVSLVAMGIFLSAFLSSRRVAMVVGYMVSLMGTLICLLLADGIYGESHVFICIRIPV